MSGDRNLLAELKIDRQQAEESRPRRWVVPLLVLLLLAAAAWWWLRPKALPVRTMTVRLAASGSGATVLNASGYVTPRREATVSSKVTGRVVEVLVEEGMSVQAGQLVARLDDTNVRASFDLAEAQLAASRSALEETRVRLNEAQKELKRVNDLATNRIATASELDRAEADVKSLEARLARQQVETTVAERQVALWKQQLDDTLIRAPFSGVVVTKDAQPGEMISPVSAGGGFTRTGICTIVDMESLEVEVEVSENYINRVKAGQGVEAALDSYPDWKIPAKVIAIIPTADRQKATVKVRVGFDKLDPRMLPQMGVKVAFRSSGSDAPEKGFTIPKTAIKRENDHAIVWAVRNGRVERRVVTTAEARGTDVLVTAGLTNDERIVVAEPERLSAGARVEEAGR